jgi:Zn-dependent protease
MARKFGIATRDITLYPIGGVARLERMSEQPWEEFCIAVAGPAVNVAIAVLLGLVWLMLGGPLGRMSMTYQPALPLEINLLGGLFWANVGLVLFNLLPAFPMDGGRVLRALLAVPLGHVTATEIAATLGIVMAVLFGLAGLFFSPMLILVAAFVFFAGQQELAAVRQREARRRAEPIDVLPADDEAVEVRPTPVNGRFSGLTWDQRFRVWVQWHNGRPIAIYGGEPE